MYESFKENIVLSYDMNLFSELELNQLEQKNESIKLNPG